MLARSLLLSIIVVSGIMAADAHAASWLEKNFWLSGPRYGRDLPACDYPAALDRIIAAFRSKEARYWKSELRIIGVENIRETAFLPWAAQSVPRRSCAGTAVVNDGQRHPMYYSIVEDAGIVGMTWGVSFCVVGLDRNWASNPECLAAQE